MDRCLACYEPLKPNAVQEYHEKCSKKVFGTTKAPVLEYEFDQIADLAKQVLNHRLAIPGVQPKLSLTLEKTNVQTDPGARLTIVGLWDGIYVLKPPNSFPKLPENEDLTMHIAQSCGIKTAVHSLVRFKSGELAYIAKRFDRIVKRKKVEKLHQEDMCQLTGLLTENKYNSSMEKVAKATLQFTTNKGLELVTLFQVTIFSFLTGNSDMHLKNFSLLKNPDGSIHLSPAYDLVATKLVAPEDKEDTALTINGKKNRLSKKDFLAFAQFCKIPDKAAESVFSGLESKLPTMKKWIEKSFLSEEMKAKYLELIRERASTIGFSTPDEF